MFESILDTVKCNLNNIFMFKEKEESSLSEHIVYTPQYELPEDCFDENDIEKEPEEEMPNDWMDIERKHYSHILYNWLNSHTSKVIKSWNVIDAQPYYFDRTRNEILVEYEDGSTETKIVYKHMLQGEFSTELPLDVNEDGEQNEQPLTKIQEWLCNNLAQIISTYQAAMESKEYTCTYTIPQDLIESDEDFDELSSLLSEQPFEIYQIAGALHLQWD